MDKEIPKDLVSFEISSESPNGSRVVFPLSKKRSLVGRGLACDVVIPFNDISTIHAVVEITKKNKVKVYDLNSKNGTKVNGERVVVAELDVNDTFYLGDNKVSISDYRSSDMPPPPLDMISSLPPAIQHEQDSREVKSLPKAPPPSVIPNSDDVVPRIKYPLAKDPRAEFSEYIFEDADELYPIFKYEVNRNAIEIIIVFNDRIQSVDYIPGKDGTYSLVGNGPKANQVEYPYLGKGDVVPFIVIKNGEAEVLPLSGYEVQSLGDTKRDSLNTPFFLYDEEIVQFSNQHIQIFVRKTYSPPKVAPAPVLRRDTEFKKYLLLMFFLVFSFLIPFSLFEVDEEIEKEKAPERIATILYKRRPTVSPFKAIDKTKDAPKVVQKSPKLSKDKPKEKVVEKDQTQKTDQNAVQKSGSKDAVKVGEVKKAEPNKGPKNVKATKVTPTVAKTTGAKSGMSRPKKASAAITNSKGAVDTYKSADFKSTVSNLISKGGSTKSAKAAADYSGGIRGSSINEADTGATLTTAMVSNNTGSLTGVTSGKLDSSKGVEGLSDKKSIYTAGLPYKTVIRGGIDPDIIRQILVENIPKFRFCYQKVLDRSKSAFNGIVRLNFIIGASGHVTKAGVDSISSLPSSVKGCVVNVLRRIPFPEPLGGGVVEVNQPMNFYPRAK
ncbi:MAG: AgmX/PglI C-terminal domain-containing protein [Bacteriovoracaceae bacterium]|nr:AgmX/PglI C-terminal domain-containing protein [Bacteriovoracaceae bacterium]